MPVTERHISNAVHRVKNMNVVYGPWALVARPVNKAEVPRTPAAEAVVAKEWQRLRSVGAWVVSFPDLERPRLSKLIKL